MNDLVKFSSDDFEAAAYIFEQMHGNTLDDYQNDLINKSALTNFNTNEVQSLIVRGIDAEFYKETELRVAAYWSLSKTFAKELIPYFRKWLRQEIDKNDTTAIFQILIALDKLNETVFPPSKTSRSWNEVENNYQYAEEYLDRLKK